MPGIGLQGLLLADRNTGPLYVLTYHAEELGENLGGLLLIAAAIQSITVTREFEPPRRGGQVAQEHAASSCPGQCDEPAEAWPTHRTLMVRGSELG